MGLRATEAMRAHDCLLVPKVQGGLTEYVFEVKRIVELARCDGLGDTMRHNATVTHTVTRNSQSPC